ncbi:MAG: hypothetical protein NTY70_18330 [Burkholderiales bacterium]|nr:hypothetical protein [Burkholderiales bacterium]
MLATLASGCATAVFITLGALTSFASSFLAADLSGDDFTAPVAGVFFSTSLPTAVAAEDFGIALLAGLIAAFFAVTGAFTDASFCAGFFIALAIESNQQEPRVSP